MKQNTADFHIMYFKSPDISIIYIPYKSQLKSEKKK